MTIFNVLENDNIHLFAFSFFTEIIIAKPKVNIHRYILSNNINTHKAAVKKCRFLLSFLI